MELADCDGHLADVMEKGTCLLDAAKRIRSDVGDVDGDGLLDSVTEYWEVAVDRNFGEVSIMRDRAERTAFLYSLGPEFYDLFEACMSFRRECQDFSS